MLQNKVNLLNAIKSISANSEVSGSVIVEAIKAIPTPEMELQRLIEKQRLKQEATVKNINSVVNAEKIIADPVEVVETPTSVKANITVDKQYLDLLKGVK